MKGIAAACLVLGVVTGMLPGSANAQARGESVQSIRELMGVDPEATYETKMADVEAWLRRFQGRYGPGPSADGGVDCNFVGSGPGLECVSGSNRADAPPATPSFTLYGLDPDNPGIRRLEIDVGSIAKHDELGKLRGNTLVFASPCPLPVHTPAPGPGRQPIPIRCYHQTRIFAPPDSDTVLFHERREITVIVPRPPPSPGGGTSRSVDPIQTTTIDHYYEWFRLADDDPREPLLKLESKELEALEQYGRMELPPLVGNLVDQAGILAPEQRAELESQLAAYELETSHRIVVVTVDHLGAQSIEEFSQQVLQTWQLGSEERTAYLLLIVAPNDGGARIEPGADLSACVPDFMALQILEEEMIPDLAYQRYGEGIQKGVTSVMAACRDWQAEPAEL